MLGNPFFSSTHPQLKNQRTKFDWLVWNFLRSSLLHLTYSWHFQNPTSENLSIPPQKIRRITKNKEKKNTIMKIIFLILSFGKALQDFLLYTKSKVDQKSIVSYYNTFSSYSLSASHFVPLCHSFHLRITTFIVLKQSKAVAVLSSAIPRPQSNEEPT